MSPENLHILQDLQNSISADRVTIWKIHGGYIVPTFMAGVAEKKRKRIFINLSQNHLGIADGAAAFNEWFIINKANDELKAHTALESVTNYHVKSSISFPIIDGSTNNVVGVFQALNNQKNGFSYEDIKKIDTARDRLSRICNESRVEHELPQEHTPQEIHKSQIDHFIKSVTAQLSMLWNRTKTIECIKLMDYDSHENRCLYWREIFLPRCHNILNDLLFVSSQTTELSRSSEILKDANPSEYEKIRTFVHQVNGLIALSHADFELLDMISLKELAKTQEEKPYPKQKVEALIESLLGVFSRFMSILKYHLSQNGIVSMDDITLGQLYDLFTSYVTWLEKYKFDTEEYLINLRVTMPADPSFIFSGDLSKIAECVETIVNNAAEELCISKVTNPLIEIVISTENNTLFISIKDNGRGIPEEYLERIFESFFTAGKKTGTGIGLGVVRELIAKMNGKINAHNDSGATFTIAIPIDKSN